MKHYKVKTESKKASKDRGNRDEALVQQLMKEYNVQSKGKTLSGHFSPDEAIDVLQTAKSRDRTVSEIVTEAVRFGLPAVKERFPPTRSSA